MILFRYRGRWLSHPTLPGFASSSAEGNPLQVTRWGEHWLFTIFMHGVESSVTDEAWNALNVLAEGSQLCRGGLRNPDGTRTA
jgi:hypothetical protein